MKEHGVAPITAAVACVFTAALGACALILQAQAALTDPRESIADPDGRVVKSEKQTFRIELVAKGLDTPWALAFLPDGRLLVTERAGENLQQPKMVL